MGSRFYYIYFHLGRHIDDDDEAAHTLVFTASPKLENGGADAVRISLSQLADSCAAAYNTPIGGEIFPAKKKNTMNVKGLSGTEREYILKHHTHHIKDNQCSSFLVKHIKAPVHLVWSLVRRFDQPQKYKPFVSRCVVQGNLQIGSLREVDVKSGLPATTSTERLELLDDNDHILSVRIIGGDHRLRNYSSTVSLHSEVIEGRIGTMVIESFVVDVPEGNTKDETCYFIEALIRCNLKSLADVSESLAVQNRTEPIDRA